MLEGEGMELLEANTLATTASHGCLGKKKEAKNQECKPTHSKHGHVQGHVVQGLIAPKQTPTCQSWFLMRNLNPKRSWGGAF